MSQNQPASPRQRRVARHEQTARDLSRALDEHGVTRAELGASLGVPPQHVGEWCDAEGERSLRIADARAIEHEGLRTAVAELVAGPGHVVVKRHEAAAKACDLAQVAKLVRGSAGLVDSMLLAHADGHISPEEARELTRRVDVLEHHLAELRAGLLDKVHVPAPVTSLRRPA